MKKISISALVLALAFAITASATTTTPLATTTITATTTVKATSTKTRPNVSNNRDGDKDRDGDRGRDTLKKTELKRASASCAKDAIAKRDGVVTSALQKYTSVWIDSINTRRVAQNAAFDKTGNERVKQLRVANEIAKKTQGTAQKELKRVKSTATDAFRAEIRLCGYGVDSIED